jgi:phosphatidylserine/phosphatidylglycerophosphate/cardiolipin synthase-like enzyme
MLSSTTTGTISIYFAPEDDLEEQVAWHIERAQVSICLQAYKFSSARITEALEKVKAERGDGLSISLLLDRTQMRRSQKAKSGTLVARQAGFVKKLESCGAQVRCVANVDKSHNKITIIDEKTVLTGSFNYKPPLKQRGKKVQEMRQADNLIVLENSLVVQSYVRMFQSYFEEGVSLS